MRLLIYYVRWHYGKAIVDYINIVRNFVWFFYNFFSLPLMVRTLFAPFRRLGESYEGKGLHFEAFFTALTVNTLMRLVGFVMRTLLIIVGLLFILLTIVAGTLFFFIWLLAPLLLLFLIIYGVELITFS